MASYETLRLILGDQLNDKHTWFAEKNERILYVLMEVRQETDYTKHHIQKICSFFAAMRKFAEHLNQQGHSVHYIRLDDQDNMQDFQKNILQLIKQFKISRFQYLLPDEYRLDKTFKRISKILPIPADAFDTEHFLTRRDDVDVFFKNKKQYLMESFYRSMRKKYQVLMENNQPEGGKWNFDASNRKPYDKKTPIPAPLLFENNVSDIKKMIDRQRVRYFGEINDKKLIWPVNRKQALDLLEYFINECLHGFGTFQDAMTVNSATLFHSRLSFALNTKMIHPMEVINAVLEYRKAHPDLIGIEQAEGFVRQVMGWREYMRGMYWTLMPQFQKMNFFSHTGKLPHYFWDGETKMNCMRMAIKQSLETAYAHHIQRLMVTGNFALLAGICPDEVDAWYLGVYIDAVEWVEKPNTRGMSQYADGGRIATKPYVSSANYIHKMSDYCNDCYYDFKKPFGNQSCPFNSLFWDFHHRHRKLLEKNARIGMMYRTWDKKKGEDQKKLLAQAEQYKNDLENL